MNKDWKEKFKIIEKQEEWYYEGIDLMEEVIEKNPDDRDAYLNICYCIVNAIIYKPTIDDYCDNIFNHYLETSYEKFKNDPEYLYFMAEIISYTDWVVKNSNIKYNEMFKKAYEIEPNNILFKSKNYSKKIFELCKCNFVNGEPIFEKPPEIKLKIKEMEEEIDDFFEIVVHQYDNIKEEYSKIGKIGELEVEYFETFCYKQLIKIGKIKPDLPPKIN